MAATIALMDYLILLSSIALGAVTVFWFRLHEAHHVKLLNAFTGGFLLTLTFLHLLPELYRAEPNHSHSGGQLLFGALILIGFYVQIALDAISAGVEHGHTHSHSHGRGIPYGVMIGLCLHAFVEALALGHEHTHFDHESRKFLLWSIVLHNYPVSIALLSMLLQSGLNKQKAIGCLAVFAAMAPIGVFVSSHTELAHLSRELMAVVIGIFMHISTTILFESSESHRFNRQKGIAIVLGTALGVAGVMFH